MKAFVSTIDIRPHFALDIVLSNIGGEVSSKSV